ncbi:MAG: peptidyl-prolyl cis-trans isomerase [Acidobacteria bacterium]|nr:peptidyl-prolyl cis-trans isomerase [Acidobacteriota bacterium]
MLNIFRRKDLVIRIVVGSILVMVSVTMVITLIPGLMTGVGLDPTVNAVVAEIGSEKITALEVQQRIMQISRMNQIPTDMMWLYTEQVLKEMILERLTLQEAKRLGVQVTEGELASQLRYDPEIFPGGNFVGQEQYEDIVFSRFGGGVEQFEQRYREAMLVDKLRGMITDSVTVSSDDIRTAFHQDNEKIVLSYVFLDPDNFKKEIRPSPPELQAYYQKNKERYQVPEKRSVKILFIESEKAREGLSIPEAELRKYYEDHKDNYRNEERVEVSHILLQAPQGQSAQVEQAQKKAAELLAQLKKGADFAALAKENSQDQASAVNGGDLGWIVRNQTVPEFEKVAFSLPPGTISDPVQTPYGIHILKVRAHEQARLRPFEEVKAEIESLLLEDRVQQDLPKIAEQAAASLRRSPNEIGVVAEKSHAVVFTPSPLSQEEAIPGIEGSQALQQEIFALEKDQVSQPIPVTRGYAVALLADISPAHPGEFAEVQEKVQADYIEEQAQNQAVSKADELTKLLAQQDKKDLKRAARSLGLTASTSEPVTRDSMIPSLGTAKEIDPKAFERSIGEVAGPLKVQGGQLVYQVDSRQMPDDADLTQQQQMIRDRLLAQKRRVVFALFQESLRNKLVAEGDLKIHQDVLARALPVGSATP